MRGLNGYHDSVRNRLLRMQSQIKIHSTSEKIEVFKSINQTISETERQFVDLTYKVSKVFDNRAKQQQEGKSLLINLDSKLNALKQLPLRSTLTDRNYETETLRQTGDSSASEKLKRVLKLLSIADVEQSIKKDSLFIENDVRKALQSIRETSHAEANRASGSIFKQKEDSSQQDVQIEKYKKDIDQLRRTVDGLRGKEVEYLNRITQDSEKEKEFADLKKAFRQLKEIESADKKQLDQFRLKLDSSEGLVKDMNVQISHLKETDSQSINQSQIKRELQVKHILQIAQEESVRLSDQINEQNVLINQYRIDATDWQRNSKLMLEKIDMIQQRSNEQVETVTSKLEEQTAQFKNQTKQFIAEVEDSVQENAILRDGMAQKEALVGSD